MKLVSVIVPTFNSSSFVSKLNKSITNQTYQNLEVIIIDNFSSDNTLDEIKKSNSNDKRFKYFQINNEGSIAKSRNYGIEKSSGDYIAFHDSDDFWYSNKVEIALDHIKDNDFTYHHLLIDNKKNLLWNNKKLFSYQLSDEPFLDLMTKGNPISTSSVLCKKSLFFNKNYFSEDKKLIAVEDYDCWINLSKKNLKFKEIPIILGKYYMGASNTSSKEKKHKEYKIIRIYNKNQYLLNHTNKILAKNHFRYLFANDLDKINIKLKYYLYLFFQKNIKISKAKLILKIIYFSLKKVL